MTTVTGTGMAIASATINPMERSGAQPPNDWRYCRSWASWPVASREMARPSVARTPGVATTSTPSSTAAAAPAILFIEEKEEASYRTLAATSKAIDSEVLSVCGRDSQDGTSSG